jgi:putative ABC transport system substrate-binding protein
MMQATRTAATTLAIQLQVLEAAGPEKIEPALAAITKGRPDALMVFGDAMFFSHREKIVSLVAKQRLPAIYVETGWAAAGGLMSYAPNVPDMHRRAATYVARILKGAKPADLPVEQPTKFELAVNLKTARALRLTIPQSILVRADKVIEP